MEPIGAILAFSIFDITVGIIYKFLGDHTDYTYLEDLYRYQKGELYWFQIRKSDIELKKQLAECKWVSENSPPFKQMLCSIESFKKITYYNGMEALKKTFCYLYENQVLTSLCLFGLSFCVLLYWKQNWSKRLKWLGKTKDENSLIDFYIQSSIKKRQKGDDEVRRLLRVEEEEKCLSLRNTTEGEREDDLEWHEE